MKTVSVTGVLTLAGCTGELATDPAEQAPVQVTEIHPYAEGDAPPEIPGEADDIAYACSDLQVGWTFERGGMVCFRCAGLDPLCTWYCCDLFIGLCDWYVDQYCMTHSS